MTTIRSAPPPMIPPRPASDARAAFFKTVAAPAVSAPAVVARQASAPPQRPIDPQAPPANPSAPNREMRPGSIIDIKV